jgi:prepilin-type N-terminal cleavage/methylation domain-containing protein
MGKRRNNGGFTLAEVMAAVAVLAIISSSVFMVISRSMESATNLALKMEAFEVARENMETIMWQNTVSESVEYGESEKNPNIQWQTVIEVFYEPIESKPWVKAVCSSSYIDADGKDQSVELTHWLTDLTEKQMEELLKGREGDIELLADQLIEYIEDAADHVGVDPKTIREWVAAGMRISEDGEYIKMYLELYRDYDGNPPREEIILADKGWERLKEENEKTEILLAKAKDNNGGPGKEWDRKDADPKDPRDPQDGGPGEPGEPEEPAWKRNRPDDILIDGHPKSWWMEKFAEELKAKSQNGQ